MTEKCDPIKEACLLRAQLRKADACRHKWHERWSWLLEEQLKAQEEADAIRREAAKTVHLQLVKEKADKSLKPVPPTSAGMVGWLAAKKECQLEIYKHWLTKIPRRLPDAWEEPHYTEKKGK